MPIFYGIDLGTTHTVVVKAKKELDSSSWECTKLELDNMPINEEDSQKKTYLLPSAVHFSADGTAVVGEYAKDAINYDTENVYINAKIDLGGRQLGGNLRQNEYNELHTPQQVSAEILKVCFSKIFQESGYNAIIRVSVPAAFSQDKRSDTEKAVQDALESLGYDGDKKLKVIRTTEEPFAALINLVVMETNVSNLLKQEKNTVMLIDIGGGTMDIIISDILYNSKDNYLQVSTPYQPAKHDEFAGARFDYELMKKFMGDFLNHYELNENEISDRERIILEKRMLVWAEDAKKFLCDRENSRRAYEFTPNFHELNINFKGKPPFKISLTKQQMDQTFEELLNNNNGTSIKKIIQRTFMDNNMTPNDIDYIYLTGGMANYDKIVSTIQSVTSRPLIVASEPLFCTATGVALSFVIQPQGISQKRKENEDEKNKDKPTPVITPSKKMGMSYYIDVKNGMPIEIISKDEIYPCIMKRANISLQTSSQSRITLILYEGNSPYDCNMKILRKKTVEFNEMINVGSTVDIFYKIDENKIITIYASINGEAPFEFNTEEV